MPTYSFGADSPLKFEISDRLATLYNEAAEEYFKAQRRFVQKFGRTWTPTSDESIVPNWTSDQKKAWNRFAKIWKDALAEQGPFHENDFMEDYLVLNVTEKIATSSVRWGRVLTAAALGGALYVVLRGLKG